MSQGGGSSAVVARRFITLAPALTGSEKAPSRQAPVIAEVPCDLGRLDVAGHGVRLAAEFTGRHGPAPALRH